MECRLIPVTGGTLPYSATRTALKLGDFALRLAGRTGRDAYLDVGCGNGHITSLVGSAFRAVVGIDMEPLRLADFRSRAPARIRVLRMSASRMAFPDSSFDLVTAFEVLEHVPDLARAVKEMARVCRPGGLIVISVPHDWFPIEAHGITIAGRGYHGKVPLLPYIRPLHRRWAMARIFSSQEMDALFPGFSLLETGYAAPQIERSAANGREWARFATPLRGTLDALSTVPGIQRFVGVSMLKAYRKPL